MAIGALPLAMPPAERAERARRLFAARVLLPVQPA
jgi:hypothetical protein